MLILVPIYLFPPPVFTPGSQISWVVGAVSCCAGLAFAAEQHSRAQPPPAKRAKCDQAQDDPVNNPADYSSQQAVVSSTYTRSQSQSAALIPGLGLILMLILVFNVDIGLGPGNWYLMQSCGTRSFSDSSPFPHWPRPLVHSEKKGERSFAD